MIYHDFFFFAWCLSEWIICSFPRYMNSYLCFNSWSASRDNWCTGTLWNMIITTQCEGMGEVGSARYEPALLPPCPSIRVLSYSNCQRSSHSTSLVDCQKFSTLRVNLTCKYQVFHKQRLLTYTQISHLLPPNFRGNSWISPTCKLVSCDNIHVFTGTDRPTISTHSSPIYHYECWKDTNKW